MMNKTDTEILRPAGPAEPMTATEEADVLRDIVNAAPHFMLLLDRDKYVLRLFNATPEVLAGYRTSDLEGNSLSVYVENPASPLHRVCVLIYGVFDEVMRTGIPVRLQYMILERHFEATVSRIPDRRVLVRMQDITSVVRNRREQERRHRNEISLAMKAGGLISWSYDVAAQALRSSPDNTVIGTYMSRKELLDKTTPRDQGRVLRMFDDLVAGRIRHAEITCQVMNCEGVPRWFNLHAVPHEYTAEGQVSAIIGSQRDVTREFEQVREAESNRVKLDLALAAGGPMPWEYRVGSCEFVFSQVCGGRVEVRRMTEQQMERLLHPDDYLVYKRNFHALVEGEVSKAQYALRYDDGKGGYCWVSVDAVAFRHAGSGKIESVIGLAKNISASIGTTDELVRLRNRAEESGRLKSAFIANMSHEIRTPLNAIVGFSHLLATTDDSEERKRYAHLVERNNELLLNLISDVLDLSKIEAGEMAFNFTAIGISDLLHRLASDIRPKVYPSVEIFVDDECPGARLTCDAARLSQILINFLTNAAKFTAVGEIRIGCRQEGGGFRFWVKDTGIGIEARQIDSVFDRFVQLNSYVQGTGLGLSLCKTIVESLEGEIGVESEPGKGSTFWCTLPDRIPEIFAVGGGAPDSE